MSLDEFLAQLIKPRVVWLMVPAAVVDQELAELAPPIGTRRHRH